MIVNIWRYNSNLKIDNLPDFHIGGWKQICVRSVYAEFDKDVSDSYITISCTGLKKEDHNPK